MAEKVQDEYIEDMDGNPIKVDRVNGRLTVVPLGSKERMEKLPSMKGREDDVNIVAFPKAGTHWTWEIATMLIRRKAETIAGAKTEHFLELVDQGVLDQQPSPRILNTHVTPDVYPRDFTERRCKILYVQRNPKDTLVSLYHHIISFPIIGYENGRWLAFFELYMKQVTFLNWFDYTLAWEKFFKENPEVPVLKLHFEDMRKNLSEEVQKIADFLDIQVDDNMLEEITKLCTFQHMQKEKPKSYPPKFLSNWKDKEYKIYRKGVVGDWKNWFTVAQSERFDAEIERKLAGSNVTIKWQ